MYYLSRGLSRRAILQMAEEENRKTEIIDTLSMERKKQAESHGYVHIDPGGQESMVLLLTEEEEKNNEKESFQHGLACENRYCPAF